MARVEPAGPDGCGVMNSLPVLPDQGLAPHYEKLKGFFGRRVRCRQEAADLTQETFLRVLRSPQHDVIRHPARLLFHVARNLLIDRGRQRARQPEFELFSEESAGSEGASPARLVESRDRLALVQAAIAELPARCREVFILNRFGGCSYPEIARRLGLSPSTVEKHMIKALAACRAALAAGERAEPGA
jgi:RNA polymerase sigma factor (sigma-70 family)